MGKRPTFTEAELNRAQKFATANDLVFSVIKRIDECEISFGPKPIASQDAADGAPRPRKFGE